MKILHYLSILFLAIITLSSCEDVVKIDVPAGESQLVVDAFIDNRRQTQTIRLTKTSPYFDNSPSPAATGAKVKVTDLILGIEYNFEDADNDGNYNWTPSAFDTICRLGFPYKLQVEYNGQTFTAESYVGRPAILDSIGNSIRKRGFGGEGNFIDLYAYDQKGKGDCYWLKAYKNGKFLNRAGEIRTAYDMAFDSESPDGGLFITPIRDFMNDEPSAIGDSVKVEIHSIAVQTLIYLNLVANELGNGGLFATPPSNVPTNIENTNIDSEIKAVGWFNTAATVEGTRIVK
jgi:hypothetical protein